MQSVLLLLALPYSLPPHPLRNGAVRGAKNRGEGEEAKGAEELVRTGQ
uniref:Uncharacterized protein n=1 Tax=Setaria italica TaxID=4555 RepID=K3XTV2_SETIT